MQQIDEPAFDELCLGQRRRNPHERLFGEADGAFGEGVDVPCEPERLEPGEEAVVEERRRFERREIAGREPQPEQILDELAEAGRDEEIPARR